MKDFKGYYRPDFNKLWDEATFVIDTNVLLNLYRSSQKASDELFDILKDLKGKDRLWMPYQFAYEYHKNLMNIHDKIEEEYNKHEKELEELGKKQCDALAETLNRFKKRHGFEIESHTAKAKEVFEEIFQDFKTFGEDHKCRLCKEPLLENKIAQLIDGIYGEDYPAPRKAEICRQDEEHGLVSSKDKANKSDPCGDLIGRRQIIDYAKENKKPVILITDDKDWFYKYKNKTKGPCPDLVQEMYDKAGVSFYSYKTSQFTKYARDYLDSQVSDETIAEIENRDRYITQQRKAARRMIEPMLAQYDEAAKITEPILARNDEAARRMIESILAQYQYDEAAKITEPILARNDEAARRMIEPILARNAEAARGMIEPTLARNTEAARGLIESILARNAEAAKRMIDSF